MIGLPAEVLQEMIVVCIIPEEGLTISNAGLMTHMENHLAYYKLPAHIVRMDVFPMNASGKVMLGELKKQAGRNYPHKSGDHQHGAAEDPLKCSESLFSTERLIKCTKMDEQIR